MMLKIAVVFFLYFTTFSFTFSQSLPLIGNWRDHLSYHQSISVVHSGNKIWSATPYSIFSVDIGDNSIDRLSKINGLSEVGVSTIAVEASTGKIIIAYSNSNVDVLYNNDVYNVDDILRSSISGNKMIHQIYVFRSKAYLSTSIGIIVLDLEKYEVADTYIIGTNGNKIKINGITSDGNSFYAATEEGLKKAPVNNINLSDFRNWSLLSGTNGLPPGVITKVASFQDKVIVVKDDSLFIGSNNNWNFLYADGWSISALNNSVGKILLSETKSSKGRIVEISLSGNPDKIIEDPRLTTFPKESIVVNNHYYIADSVAGLLSFDGNSFERYVPNSPKSVATGEMVTDNNVFWATAGSVTTNWEPVNNKNGLYRFSSGTWTNYNAYTFSQLDSFADFITIAIDPDQSTWAGSYGGGLLNIKSNNTFTVYKQNSPIKPAFFSPESYRVSGLAFDTQRNLWISNYGANEILLVKTPGNTWFDFTPPFPITENAAAQIVIDDVNQKWIISPKENGLIVFSHGLSIENSGDDQWKLYRNGKGNGNLPSNNVLSIAKDKNGFIWVGTDKGIGIIQCPQEALTILGCEGILPVVQQGNFAGYLFRDETVQVIAIDGADRKWIGTTNGVWLISADGEKTILRFTKENSPLFSNDVKKITIDGNTGEVFFSTSKGICSFIGNSTEGGTTNNNIIVFPNPVPPGYFGSIAIRGLINNSIVKITELDGRLVFQARSLGGQVTWHGKDYKGRHVSSGVYLVLVSDEGGKGISITKIVFIKK